MEGEVFHESRLFVCACGSPRHDVGRRSSLRSSHPSIIGPPYIRALWRVDPSRGVLSLVQTDLRPFLFYEFHYLVRAKAVPSTSLMDDVVAEGMATAFERDFAGASPPWGIYPRDVDDWAKELMALPVKAPADEWITQPTSANGGRRWMGLRAGTYLVDRATRASGKSSAELVTTSTQNILKMALGR